VADETDVLYVCHPLLVFFSQFCECVNNNTENDVEQDCFHLKEVRPVKNRLKVPALSILRNGGLCGQELSDSSSCSEAIVDSREEAVHHGHTNAVSFSVKQTSMDVVIVESVRNEDERKHRVNVDDDPSKHSRHHQRLPIHSYRSHHTLKWREPIDHVCEMARVKDWRLNEALEGESHVSQTEDEIRVLHQERQTNPLVFKFYCGKFKASFPIFVESWMFRTFCKQKSPDCRKREVINIETAKGWVERVKDESHIVLQSNFVFNLLLPPP